MANGEPRKIGGREVKEDVKSGRFVAVDDPLDTGEFDTYGFEQIRLADGSTVEHSPTLEGLAPDVVREIEMACLEIHNELNNVVIDITP